ncbi:AAA family ATPase [Paenibacillus thailandensis]|uniref:AAA family ATPase n=1 Tax=Paenibacillus thailandensis TaxID=393250 RepID=A0ABW5QUE0_9BACL
MRRLVFFIGPAGAGKTTIAKALVERRKDAVFLDMDTTLRPAAEAIMAAAGLDPNDRDSDDYKRLCRDLGYRMTMNAALENLELGLNVFVVGPFTREVGQADWLDRELARIGLAISDVDVKVVSVHVESETLYRERIERRQLASDEWKLKHWDRFRQSLSLREIGWAIPPANRLVFNNSEPLTERRLEAVERFIY